jgi:hypothetical protein
LESEEAFTTAVVAVQDGDTGQGKTLLPEPADGLGFGFGEIFSIDGERDG